MRIRKKLFITFAMVAVIPALFLSGLFYLYVQRSLTRITFTNLSNVADLKAKSIERLFVRFKEDMVVAQNYYNIKTNFPVLLHSRGESSNSVYRIAQDNLDRQLSVLKEERGLIDVLLVSSKGRIIYTLSKKHERLLVDDVFSLNFATVSPGWKKVPWLSEIFFYEGQFVMFVAAAAFDLDQEFTGFIVYVVNMEPLYSLVQDTIGLGETGETLIVKKEGRQVVYLNRLRHDPGAALNKKINLYGSIGIPALRAVEGLAGQGITRDYRGKQVIAVWRKLNVLDWGLVSKIDTQEAFGPIARIGNLVVILLFFTFMFAIFTALWIARSIAAPIRNLQQGVKIFESGNFDYRVGVKSQDEVGELSRAFDHMVESLKRITVSRDELNKEIVLRRDAEVKLKKAMQELERSNKELEQFASVASHDLQEPLRKVVSFGGLLQARYQQKLEGDASRFVAYMMDAAVRMQALINDLLEYARISKPEVLQPVNVSEALKDALHNLDMVIQDRQARITADVLPRVMVHRMRMVQVLQNLLGNAIKFCRDTRPEIYITCKKTEAEWIFCVRDNGIGIESAYFDKIFGLFQHLHTQQEYPGTGIGLALCKKIVESWGGRIWVESEFGKGAQFFFTVLDNETKKEEA